MIESTNKERTEDVQEALRILQEECAEVIQAISKIFRFGEDSRWPEDNITNLEQLEMELGDIFCMMNYLMEKKYVNEKEVLRYGIVKKEKLKKWSNIK
jgi:NTP pyrophosphatase (non-canonical NTP hydrolase)